MIEDAALASYLRFLSFTHRPLQAASLTEGAFLAAEIATPELDRARYEQRLAGYAAAVRAEVGMEDGARLSAEVLDQRATAERVLTALRVVLAERTGLRGATTDYYDPRNSLFPAVLDRRVGIPLTLSLIYLDVARRIGAPLEGVAFPAHFLTRWPLPLRHGGAIYLDAFDGGHTIDRRDMLAFFERLLASGTRGQEDSAEVTDLSPRARALFNPSWLDGADARTILTRLFSNLKRAYLQRGQTALALEVTDRLVLLRPDRPEEVRDRGLLRLAMGEPLLAAADIACYVERVPSAPDVKRLRRRIDAAARVRATLN